MIKKKQMSKKRKREENFFGSEGVVLITQQKKKRRKKEFIKTGKWQINFSRLQQPKLWPQIFQQFQNKNEFDIVLGIDMSLNSPALTKIDLKNKMIEFYYFRQRQKDRSGIYEIKVSDPISIFHNWIMKTICLEDEDNDMEKKSIYRYTDYLKNISKLIKIIENEKNKRIIIGIEGYSMKSIASSANMKLIELGGCLRQKLIEMNLDVVEIPPMTNKKIFCGSGKADKKQMCSTYTDYFRLPCLYEAIDMTKKNYSIIPSPIDDIVDSLGITLTTILTITKQ